MLFSFSFLGLEPLVTDLIQKAKAPYDLGVMNTASLQRTRHTGSRQVL